MTELLILVLMIIILSIFFRKEGDTRPGLNIHFPTKDDEKGIRTRQNGIILLVLMVGLFIYITLRTNSGRLYVSDAIVFAGAVAVVLFSYFQNKKKRK
jgi:hypothetical protein